MLPALPPADLVIDAAFGTGFHGVWRAPRHRRRDGAGGRHPEWGRRQHRVGGRRHAHADVTVTFAAAKPGLYLGKGRELAGDVRVVDIGLDVSSATAHVVEASDVARWIGRGGNAHKWAQAVRVVAGSSGMTRAAHLVTAGAQRAGAGMVRVEPGVEGNPPIEAVSRRIPSFDWADAVLNDLYRFHSLVVGPGLGREDHTVPSVTKLVIDAIVPVVVDGDGLFALAWNEHGAPTMLLSREVPTILTPHDGEYALLTGHRPGDDRLAAARQLAADTGATVLLKGPTTVVASPSGDARLVVNGDQRLATAGTGDVLAGIIGALAATGIDVLHGRGSRGVAARAAASFGPSAVSCERPAGASSRRARVVGLTAPMDGCE